MSYSNRTNYGVEESVLDSGKVLVFHILYTTQEKKYELEFKSMEWNTVEIKVP